MIPTVKYIWFIFGLKYSQVSKQYFEIERKHLKAKTGLLYQSDCVRYILKGTSAKGRCSLYGPEQLILAVHVQGVWPVGISQVSDSNSPCAAKGKFDQKANLWLNIGHHAQSNTAFLQLMDTWKT